MIKRIFALCLSLLAAGVSAQECIPLDSRSGHIRWEVRPSEGDALPAVPAIVPGCVFASYVAAGVEADPNFGDNAYRTDKSRYDRNFRYTGLFPTPPVGKGRTLWLRFEGVNRKGTVRLNGHQLGHLDGFMQPGDYDITRLVAPDGENRLEVEVEWVGYPVPNFRSPTYISSAGWDWMPYAPGLLSGITDDVYLSLSGDVRLVEPWVRTKVPDREHAKVELLTDVENRSDKACEGVLRGEIRPGGIAFSHPVRLEAGERRTIRLTEREVPGLAVEHPQLWWPNGMGDPALYTCRLVFETDGRQSDARTVTFGIREYGYEWHDGIFRLKINGEPVYVKGGNWGMSEWLLRCRGEEYDTRVALHRHMHFNMIRNWIGSTTDEEFYDACDRHGIMIWDDFWLNSHPNLPHDLGAFQQNAVEKIKRLRNHPSIAVWCGDRPRSTTGCAATSPTTTAATASTSPYPMRRDFREAGRGPISTPAGTSLPTRCPTVTKAARHGVSAPKSARRYSRRSRVFANSCPRSRGGPATTCGTNISSASRRPTPPRTNISRPWPKTTARQTGSRISAARRSCST